MGEKDDPVVADELVEIDVASGGLGLEVGSDASEAEAIRDQSLFVIHGQNTITSKTYGSGLEAIVRVCGMLR